MATSSSKRRQFWHADWFVGVLVVLAVLALHSATDFFATLERRYYDFASTSTSRQPSDRLAIIAIDDQSIANIGRWPWPRDVHAQLIDQLAAAKAKTIAHTAFFFEPQTDRGLVFIRKIKEALGPPGDPVVSEGGLNERLGKMIADAEVALDTDAKLAASMAKAGNVLVPSVFVLGEPQGKADNPLPAYALKSAIEEPAGFSLPAIRGQQPIEIIGNSAAGVAHLNQLPDVDGAVRQEPLLINYYGKAVPSMGLLAAVKSLNLAVSDIRLNGGESVQIGKLRIATDEAALRAHRPQVVLVALEPSIEHALDRLDTLLHDPALTVIYDEAELAAHRAGWDAARWVRHLSAKIRHDKNVLPPGTESDQDWQPSPGQIPKPAAAYADVDLTVFTREAVASAGSVPTDGMQAEPALALQDLMALDTALLDAIPLAAVPPPLPSAPPVFEIQSFQIESFESQAFEAQLFDRQTSEAASFESVSQKSFGSGRSERDTTMTYAAASMDSATIASLSLVSVEMEGLELEGLELESTELEAVSLDSMPLDSMALDSMSLEAMQFEDNALVTSSLPPAINSVTPMHLDDDAFFLQSVADTDAVPADDSLNHSPFDGGFDTHLDFDDDTGPVSATVAVPRSFETVLSFEELIANSTSVGENASASAEAIPQIRSPSAFSLGDLSLAPVDELPAVAEKSIDAPRTHDLYAFEARISSLSLVDLDDGASKKADISCINADVIGVVLVEAGLGGPDPARQLLSSIPAEFPAVVLVRLHLQGGRYDRLVAQMERASALPVALAQAGAGANPGTIYFLPDGIGFAVCGVGLEFTADAAPVEALFDALPPGNSAIVFLSGSDPQLVDNAMTTAARGTLVVAQSAEDCYDGAACAELRKRGAASGLPAELAGRLASRWPS